MCVLTQLDELRELVRSPLSKIGRQILSALIVIEVHARDVVTNMVDQEVSNVNDFEWISQLRSVHRPTKALSTLSQKNATVAVVSPYSAIVSLLCDSLTFVRQSHFPATLWTGFNRYAFADLHRRAGQFFWFCLGWTSFTLKYFQQRPKIMEKCFAIFRWLPHPHPGSYAYRADFVGFLTRRFSFCLFLLLLYQYLISFRYSSCC